MPDDTDHRCRSGRVCSGRTADGPAATPKRGTLCQQCVTAIQAQRGKLPILRDAVKVFVGVKPKTAMVSKVSATPMPACPINLAAESLLNEIDDVLGRVGALLIRDLVQQPPRKFRTWDGDHEQRVWWDGVDLALQIRRTHSRAVKMLGVEPQWQRRAAPCWACGCSTLGQLTGSATVECSNCGERKTDVDYEKYCVDVIADRKGKKNGR